MTISEPARIIGTFDLASSVGDTTVITVIRVVNVHDIRITWPGESQTIDGQCRPIDDARALPKPSISHET